MMTPQMVAIPAEITAAPNIVRWIAGAVTPMTFSSFGLDRFFMAPFNHELGFRMLNAGMEITDALPGPATLLPLQQHPNFAKAVLAMGGTARVMTMRNRSRRIGNALMVKRSLVRLATVGMVSQGPVWSPDTTIDHRIDAYRSMVKDGLRVVNSVDGDEVALAQSGFRKFATHSTVVEWDLSAGNAQRRAGMTQNWRNRLSKANRNGLGCRSLRYEPGGEDWFLRAEALQRRSRKYRTLPLRFTTRYMQVNPNDSRLFVAFDGRERVAAALVLIHGLVATYHIGWTSQLGRELCAHNLILDQAAEWLTGRGVARFDLGTIDTDHAPGIARFKLGTGAASRPLGGTWLNILG